jgi:hypothetical protein
MGYGHQTPYVRFNRDRFVMGLYRERPVIKLLHASKTSAFCTFLETIRIVTRVGGENPQKAAQ